MQIDLFQHRPNVRSEPVHYPESAGWQKTDTSKQAAKQVTPKAKVVRERVLECLRFNPQGLTTEEIAERIDVAYHTTQPRLSELQAKGKVRDSGKRKKNANGKNIIIWQAIREQSDGSL